MLTSQSVEQEESARPTEFIERDRICYLYLPGDNPPPPIPLRAYGGVPDPTENSSRQHRPNLNQLERWYKKGCKRRTPPSLPREQNYILASK